MLDNGQDRDYLLSLPSCSLSQGLTLLTVGARMTTPSVSYTDHVIAIVCMEMSKCVRVWRDLQRGHRSALGVISPRNGWRKCPGWYRKHEVQ